MNQLVKLNDVLTLEETAKFLRVPKKKVQALAEKGMIPARQIEKDWRFSKRAVEEWLSGPYKEDGKTAMLRMAGAFADDETLAPMRKEIYRQRGRPETEEESQD